MTLTIRNKLILGFSATILLMGAVAGIGAYAVLNLRQSARDATHIGGRLNSVALEIQVHNLEAERRIKNYLIQSKIIGAQKAHETYVEEAQFEISEIQSVTQKAISLAPSEEAKAKFKQIAERANVFEAAVNKLVDATEHNVPADQLAADTTAYEAAADSLHDSAEDGEVTGRDASQQSLDDIEKVSKDSVSLVTGISLVGLLLGIAVSYNLTRAILQPVDHLKGVAESVSLGNLDIAVRRYSNDEIGDLADSFSRMVTAVKFLQMESDEKGGAE